MTRRACLTEWQQEGPARRVRRPAFAAGVNQNPFWLTSRTQTTCQSAQPGSRKGNNTPADTSLKLDGFKPSSYQDRQPRHRLLLERKTRPPAGKTGRRRQIRRADDEVTVSPSDQKACCAHRLVCRPISFFSPLGYLKLDWFNQSSLHSCAARLPGRDNRGPAILGSGCKSILGHYAAGQFFRARLRAGAGCRRKLFPPMAQDTVLRHRSSVFARGLD
jgi:hypothetical protein